MSRLLGKKYLLAALKAAHEKTKEEYKAKGDPKGPDIPYSYKSLIRYENAGVLPKSKHTIGMEVDDPWRLYTEADIARIVEIMVKFKVKEYEEAQAKRV